MKRKVIAGILIMTTLALGACGNQDGSNSVGENNTEENSQVQTELKEDDNASLTENASFNAVVDELSQELVNEPAPEGEEPKTETEEITSQERDYDVMADEIVKQMDTFFNALTTGDINTLLEICDENDEYYEQLVVMSEFECTPQFLQTVFGDVKYYMDESAIKEFVGSLERAYENGKEYLSIPVESSIPYFMMMSNMYPTAFEDGTKIEIDWTYMNNEEAFTLLEQAMSVLPMRNNTSALRMKLPADGNEVKFQISYFLEELDLDSCYDMVGGSFTLMAENNYPSWFASEYLEHACDKIVGNQGYSFEKNHDLLVELHQYLSTKDFKGLEAFLSDITCCDYEKDFSSRYGSYEALTDTQKQFVDNFIEEEFCYQFIDTASENGNYRATYVLTWPILDEYDVELTNWYNENDVRTWVIGYSSESNNFANYKDFLWAYYSTISYAAKCIE